MTDADEIRALLAAREAAMEAGDADAVIASTVNGSMVYDLPPPLAIVHDATTGAEALREWFGTWNGPVRSRCADPVVLVSDDLAVAHGLVRMQGDKKNEGPTDLWFRSTVVLRRQDGRWRIVHEHNSVPLTMDGSGRAATDLTPDQA